MALLAGSVLTGATPASASTTAPPWPCIQLGTGYVACTQYNGAAAAAYADEYAINPNPVYPTFDDDCTNFISQALIENGHLGIGEDDEPPSVSLVDDDAMWGISEPWRSLSFTVANDLWNFENQLVPFNAGGFNTKVPADPYGSIWDWANGGTVPVGGAFIPNSQMDTTFPQDLDGDSLPMAPGDFIFYNWQYAGTAYDEGFFADHAAFVVSAVGTDPDSGWGGPLVDEHTSNRSHAIWNLIPYNSQFQQTTAAWWDTLYQDGPPITGSATPATDMQRISHTRPQEIRARTAAAKPYVPGKRSAITTPTTPAAQRAYSGPLAADSGIMAQQRAAITTVFQNAMAARQQVFVPSVPANIPAAQRPASSALQQMTSNGDQRLSALFTGQQLKHEETMLSSARSADAVSDVRVLGGGADSFHYSSIQRLADGQVELRGTVRAWEKVAQVQNGGRKLVPATPHNTLDVSATLTHTATGWKVSNLNWAFAPGSQP